ncbi:MAG TPA: glycosyltransferase, partial [Burkholderiales bacterium]
MLRILFLTGSLAHGGAERHSVSLMNGLSGRGHECHVVYVKRDGDLVEHIRLASGGSVHCLDATRYFDWRALLDLARHVNHIRPHAIVAVNSYALMYAALALRLVRQRVCLVVTYHSTRLTSLRERLQMMAYRPMFWTADRLIFVCVAQMRHCIRRAVFARANEVIHNGVDVMHFRSSGDKQARGRLRAAFGFLDSDFVIGLPALLRAEKNHIQLVDAVAALRHAGIPARVLMIGDGPMRARIEARARERAVERHVAITGLQRDVRPYIAACDVVAVCSITEAFSMA